MVLFPMLFDGEVVAAVTAGSGLGLLTVDVSGTLACEAIEVEMTWFILGGKGSIGFLMSGVTISDNLVAEAATGKAVLV